MAMSPSAETAVAEFAGQLFFRLWRASHTRFAETLEPLGLTTALFALLNVIGPREVAITPKGRRVLEQARELAIQAEDDVLGGLSDPQRRQLLTLLRRALDSAPAQPLWSSDEGTSTGPAI